MRARDIMTTRTVAVTPSATLEEAAEVMAGRGFTTLPVIDGDGRLLGLLSEVDILCATRGPADPDSGVLLDRQVRTAGAAMRTPGVGAHPDAEVAALARRMAGAGVRSLPVLVEGRVVGMVTFQDALRSLGDTEPG
ncbi:MULTISPECIES: CBS domain-containing protein [unclassified Amycolatopsis]|uniref:CBS domain-containing protein n=1 Tax=unclassified Amycolatopsis TaxID=2618356 RepID=UPI002E1FB504|nr:MULTISPECIES: CBS domain-containing protein [unclassified Amycolatopsis]